MVSELDNLCSRCTVRITVKNWNFFNQFPDKGPKGKRKVCFGSQIHVVYGSLCCSYFFLKTFAFILIVFGTCHLSNLRISILCGRLWVLYFVNIDGMSIFVVFCILRLGLSWSWSYGSWIYNYICKQCFHH